ncbi:hypothetical protein MTR67_027806 [Solanum verrucosum]|uniref:Terpene synthase metal-binding domain-containing protein n=1 Tax=Solanum verrucosum TaxID=315347 RepID=A0AAF0R9V1_SOLVR|nr:hypothetical protein MTR67_027800 [Solanum verrucosum]WMV34421.1 hypothetical protein MTR67_027806 [Solanum verrucosum]
MDGGMGLHSYIAQVDLERKHVIHELNRAKTQVPRISILHVVDPAEHSRVSGEPPCFPEDSIILCTQFCSIRMLREPAPERAWRAYQQRLPWSGVEEFISRETFEWLMNVPLIVRASSAINRITCDMTGHEVEQQRAHISSIIECYMKEYEASKEET